MLDTILIIITGTKVFHKLLMLIFVTNVFVCCCLSWMYFALYTTLIHLNNNSVILSKLFDAWKSHFFIEGVALSHYGRRFFMVDSYVKVKLILLNLTKFSISHWSLNTWHESDDINSLTIKYALKEQLEMHCIEISSN